MTDRDIIFKFDGEEIQKLESLKIPHSFLFGVSENIAKIAKKIAKIEKYNSKDFDFNIELKEGSVKIHTSPIDMDDLQGTNILKNTATYIDRVSKNDLSDIPSKFVDDEQMRKYCLKLLHNAGTFADNVELFDGETKINEKIELAPFEELNESPVDDEAPFWYHIVQVHLVNDNYHYAGFDFSPKKCLLSKISIPWEKELLKLQTTKKYVYIRVGNNGKGKRSSLYNFTPFTELTNPLEDEFLSNYKKMESKISEFSQLNQNWDGYNGSVIDPRTIELANKNILLFSNFIKELELNVELPWIVPVPNGNIQFEWEIGDFGLEIEFNFNESYEILKTTMSDGKHNFEEFKVGSFMDTLDSILWILKKYTNEGNDE